VAHRVLEEAALEWKSARAVVTFDDLPRKE
jgi:hypothetical protein